MLQAFISGTLLGLSSVPHCAAMCGPLAAFACSRSARRGSPLRYQFGRTLSYGVAGALAGHAGDALLHAITPGSVTARVVLFASLAAGACLLLARTLFAPRRHPAELAQLGRKPRARSLSSRLLGLAPRDAAAFGVLSLFLPCAVLAAALLVAAASGDGRSGALTMVGFATGSGVALFAAGALMRTFRLHASPIAQRLAAVALVLAAIGLMIHPLIALTSGTARADAAAPRCH